LCDWAWAWDEVGIDLAEGREIGMDREAAETAVEKSALTGVRSSRGFAREVRTDGSQRDDIVGGVVRVSLRDMRGDGGVWGSDDAGRAGGSATAIAIAGDRIGSGEVMLWARDGWCMGCGVGSRSGCRGSKSAAGSAHGAFVAGAEDSGCDWDADVRK
jgi:hypothetical protein